MLRPFRFLRFAFPVSAALGAAACQPPAPEPPEDPPIVTVGERLFLETRFAELFAANATGINEPLAAGDPVLDTLEVADGDPRPGPFAGQSMSCRPCHLVDESPEPDTRGIRTYGDFARRSPIPDRGDGRTHTPRNSPPLVNASLPRDVPFYLHFDGQFASDEELVGGTLTGRNFGWLPDESAAAVAHIARVVREDDGRAAPLGPCGPLPYATIFAGVAPEIPAACRLEPVDRIDVTVAADADVLAAVGHLVAGYMRSLAYLTDDAGNYVGSPYDRFLILNRLPRRPEPGESAADYARRLRGAIDALPAPKWLDNPGVLAFTHHDQPFAFGPDELRGLRIFLAEPAAAVASSDELGRGGVGNCAACHAPPEFTDFGFHNDGAAQAEYDGIAGPGAFAALAVPTLAERQAAPERYLPASSLYPTGAGTFLKPPSADHPGEVDLGLWNVFANDAVPSPQATLPDSIRRATGAPADATADELLARAVALFKTATVRDLGQSPPYLHTGAAATIEDVIAHYRRSADLARAGQLRNGAPELAGIALGDEDVAPLAAFLRSLDEDYE